MKHLFIALVCTVMGFSTYASSTPKKSLPFVVKKEVKAVVATNKAELASTKNNNKATAAFFRKQYSFCYYDGCGQVMTVWVSAGNNVSVSDMEMAGATYAYGTLSGNMCFPR